MARFKIETPVPGYTGNVGGVDFVKGSAVVDSASEHGASQLAYFRTQGYEIEPLDGVDVEQAIDRAALDPTQETGKLKRENAALEERLSLDELRRRNAELRERVERESTPDASDVPAARIGGPAPAPPDDAPVAEWRKHAVAELGVSEIDAKRMDKGQLQERDRQVRDELARNQDGGAQ